MKGPASRWYWEQDPATGRGWWACAGRVNYWPSAPWFQWERGTYVLSFFGWFGVSVSTESGVFVSVGAAYVGHAGVGWHQ